MPPQRSRRRAPLALSLDLLVRVHAVSVNPLEGKIRRGELRLLSGARFPKTPGIDFAGVVEAVGAKVTGFAVGPHRHFVVGSDFPIP
ncbi:MAG: alcohol dehydrogenase catalytic domain-containing protein [Labilithrix sp.]|nr:alcohol dehydrogenase catalytic domain-containing protein [Labilithrix sp.]